MGSLMCIKMPGCIGLILFIVVAYLLITDSPAGSNEQLTQISPLPTIPYGAVYFRKSSLPEEDWGVVTRCRLMLGDKKLVFRNGTITINILARDGLILELL